MMPSPAGPSLFDELEKGLISDIRANDLLTELHRGLSPEGLRPALRAERDEVVKTAVWILAELAGGGFALWDELPRLFRHTDKRVRYWAVDAAHHAVPSDPVMLAEVAALVGDSEFVVAWRALKLVVTASDEQVEAAARTFPALGVLLGDASSPIAPVEQNVAPMDHRLAVARLLRSPGGRTHLGKLVADQDLAVQRLASDLSESQ